MKFRENIKIGSKNWKPKLNTRYIARYTYPPAVHAYGGLYEIEVDELENRYSFYYYCTVKEIISVNPRCSGIRNGGGWYFSPKDFIRKV